MLLKLLFILLSFFKVNNYEYNLIIDFDFMNDCYSEWFYFAVANISASKFIFKYSYNFII